MDLVLQSFALTNVAGTSVASIILVMPTHNIFIPNALVDTHATFKSASTESTSTELARSTACVELSPHSMSSVACALNSRQSTLKKHLASEAVSLFAHHPIASLA